MQQEMICLAKVRLETAITTLRTSTIDREAKAVKCMSIGSNINNNSSRSSQQEQCNLFDTK